MPHFKTHKRIRKILWRNMPKARNRIKMKAQATSVRKEIVVLLSCDVLITASQKLNTSWISQLSDPSSYLHLDYEPISELQAVVSQVITLFPWAIFHRSAQTCRPHPTSPAQEHKDWTGRPIVLACACLFSFIDSIFDTLCHFVSFPVSNGSPPWIPITLYFLPTLGWYKDPLILWMEVKPNPSQPLYFTWQNSFLHQATISSTLLKSKLWQLALDQAMPASSLCLYIGSNPSCSPNQAPPPQLVLCFTDGAAFCTRAFEIFFLLADIFHPVLISDFLTRTSISYAFMNLSTSIITFRDP